MKYFITAIVILIITIICIACYLNLKPDFLVVNNTESYQQTSFIEQAKINQRLDKLYNNIIDLQDILNQQVLHSQRLEEEDLFNSAKVAILEKKFQDMVARIERILSENPSFTGAPSLLAPTESRNYGVEPAFQAFSPELFQNPEFAKLFQEQVLQTIQEKERKEREKREAEMVIRNRERITQRINKFAKAQNLTDYQQQEFTKLVMERSAKTTELITKMRTQGITGEEYKNQQTAIRNDYNDRIKQILLPQQYEEYRKIEPQLNSGGIVASSEVGSYTYTIDMGLK